MRILLALAAIFLATSGAKAADEVVVDLVWITVPKPIIVRVHLRESAAKAIECWETFIAEWFDFLDRDGDGKLSPTELQRAPSPQQLAEQWQAGLYPRLGIAGAVFAKTDVDNNGWASRAELDRHYRLGGAGPLPIAKKKQLDAQSSALTEVLFTRLDRDGNGKLDRKELREAFGALRVLDTNDDEILTPDELLVEAPNKKMATPALTGEVLILGLNGALRKTQRELLMRAARKHYPRTTIAELSTLLDRPPDVEVIVADQAIAKAKQPEDWELLGQHGSLTASSSRGIIYMRTALPDRSIAVGVKQFFRQQFLTADRKQRGHVEKAELNIPALAALRDIFDLADRDGNGKLTEAELIRCVDLHVKSLESHVNLSFAIDRAGLFELLDANQDGRLTLREIQDGVDRLLRFAKGNDGLSRDDLPRRLSLVWSVGPTSQSAAKAPLSATCPEATPRWFKLMDRNGDGDVSPREWIGPLEQFRRLDLNGDGLIGVDEAIEADKKKQLKK